MGILANNNTQTSAFRYVELLGRAKQARLLGEKKDINGLFLSEIDRLAKTGAKP